MIIPDPVVMTASLWNLACTGADFSPSAVMTEMETGCSATAPIGLPTLTCSDFAALSAQLLAFSFRSVLPPPSKSTWAGGEKLTSISPFPEPKLSPSRPIVLVGEISAGHLVMGGGGVIETP